MARKIWAGQGGMSYRQKLEYWQAESNYYDKKARQREIETKARFANVDDGPTEYEKETALRNARITTKRINAGIGRQKYRLNEAETTSELAELELAGAGQREIREAGEDMARQKRRITKMTSPDEPPPASPAAPSIITSCDASGCWDNHGGRYNRGGGSTYFPASGGGACQMIGNQMQCP